MRLSVNILTWNNQSTISTIIDSLALEISDIMNEIIFVDNGSTDDTVKIAKESFANNGVYDITFAINKRNEGISKGKNIGINLSSGKYILFLDGDVVPVANSIKKMILWLDENPDKVAIGMYPNKFTTTDQDAEVFCRELVNINEHPCACLFYGLYRRSIFDKGLRMNEEGLFGEEGYGWEDHDFYERFKACGHKQYAADINSNRGRYFHAINSSIRAMGHTKYMQTSRERAKQFHEVWGA
jgi:glycosyltransferase involved in cell wall biosynthesis